MRCCLRLESLRVTGRYYYKSNYKVPAPTAAAAISSHCLISRCTISSRWHSSPCKRNVNDDTGNNNNNNNNSNLRLLNKSLYQDSLKCHRLGWFARRKLLPSDRNGTKNIMREYLVREGIAFENYVYAHNYGYHHNDNDVDDDNNNSSNTNSNSGPTGLPHQRLAVVHDRSPSDAAKNTQSLLANNRSGESIDVVLQPTFLTGNLVARADAMVRSNQGTTTNESSSWEIVEIKSSTEKSFRKKIPDLSFTVHVARSCGYNIVKASLIVVDPNYVHTTHTAKSSSNHDPHNDNETKASGDCGDSNEGTNNNNNNNCLYKTIDCTDLVEKYILENKLDETVTAIDEITGNEIATTTKSTNKADSNQNNLSMPPPVEYKVACGKCELLGVECGPFSLEHGIWEIPRLSQKQFPEVLEQALPTLEVKDLGLALARDTDSSSSSSSSSSKLLTPNQKRFVHAVATNTVVVDRAKLENHLSDIRKASTFVFYLDFEAVSVLRPPYPGMVPYETMVTQYSLHKQQQQEEQSFQDQEESNDDRRRLFHSEYLADHKRDCRKELLERLLNDLGYRTTANDSCSSSSGPILVYSSYEKTQLNKLAKLFPEHLEPISHIIDHRLVDLEKIIKDCVSHPNFCGRTSIKTTLPALVPGFEQAYQDLPGIAEGTAAGAAFAELLSGVRSSSSTVQQTQRALLSYCALDTLALVEIHGALQKLTTPLRTSDDDDNHQRKDTKQQSMPAKGTTEARLSEKKVDTTTAALVC